MNEETSLHTPLASDRPVPVLAYPASVIQGRIGWRADVADALAQILGGRRSPGELMVWIREDVGFDMFRPRRPVTTLPATTLPGLTAEASEARGARRQSPRRLAATSLPFRRRSSRKWLESQNGTPGQGLERPTKV